MNILQIRPTLTTGGASEYVIGLSKGLAAKGHKIIIVSGGGELGDRVRSWSSYHDDLDLSPRSGTCGIPNITGLLRSSARVVGMVRSEHIDVINTHHRFAALIGKIASRSTGIPMISTMHETRKNGRWMTTAGLGDRVVVLSAAVKAHVVETYGVPPERVSVVPMGIAATSAGSIESADRLARQIGLEPDHPIVGCVARLTHAKGQTYLLEAIPKILLDHPTAQFVFVGDGPDRPLLEARSRTLMITRNVLFLGNRSDVADLMPMFDLTVLPTLHEAFGVAVIESLAHGVPVVASAVGGVPEIVQDHVNGRLVAPRNADLLHAAIAPLLNAPEELRRLGINGQQMVRRRYCPEHFVERTEQVYRSVLGRSSANLQQRMVSASP